ncbi:FYVE [Mactra antiquata]
MDLKNGGTETQMINTNINSKPRPPSQSLKPKPALPKKPAIAVKPSNLSEKPLSQNGPPPVPKAKPSTREKVVQQDILDSPKSSPPRTTRPKEPPPPLPKTAPKGSVVQKTPPPLPKTPPRVSVRKKTNDSEDIKVNGDVESNDSSSETVTPVDPKTVNDCMDNDSKSVTSLPSCDKTNGSSVKGDNNDGNLAFANEKSTSETSISPICTAPKVPEKPKPSPKSKQNIEKNSNIPDYSVSEPPKNNKDSNENSNTNSEDDASNTQVSQSKWFVDAVNNDITERSTSDANTDSKIHFLKGQDDTGNSKVWFNKTISPKHSPKNSPKNSPRSSPIVPRKPPPRVTPKPKPTCDPKLDAENDKSVSASSSDQSLSEKSQNSIEKKSDTFHGTNIRDQTKTALNDNNVSDIDKTKNNYQDAKNDEISKTTESVKQKGSPKPLPKPVPRKPAPVVRPRPTPRKRLSINRLSGSDETFDAVGSNNTGNTQSAEVTRDIRDNNCDPKSNNSVVEQSANTKTETRDLTLNKGHEAVDKHIEDEVQYRVIEKHTRSQSHITELEDNDDEPVILRKKIAREENVEEEELTLEELKSIGHLLEGSDDEDQDNDKFVKKVPIENGQEKTTEVTDDSNGKVSNVESGSVKNSIENILEDKSLLEPSSLLNEIEDILTRSFKHSSLTRSGSSPEKKSSPYLSVDEVCKTMRSQSVDVQSDIPVRPPRPKKEQKRLRSMSQTVYDSCGSDTESLPDLSRHRDEHCLSGNISLTLSKAKPHPPKPKRHKLLKVQRSQSDITAMKSVVDKIDLRDARSPKKNGAVPDSAKVNNFGNDSKNKPSNFKKRPTRKAPDPPKGNVAPPTSSRVSLDTVVPVDARVKSMSLDSRDNAKNKRDCMSMMSPGGAFYHCIHDDDIVSSDGDHDYQDISDDEKFFKNESHSLQHGHHLVKGKHQGQKKIMTPPKLPPRNINNSHSFDNSSLSSAGFDSVITSVASSAEDVSLSSGCFEQDMNSPGVKNPLIMRSMYPKTSSPYVKGNIPAKSDENIHISGLVPSNSSLSDSHDDRSLRPVSGCSIQSGSWSGSAEPDQSSSDSDMDDEEKITRKREKKLFMIAQEIASSEHVFVDVLKLLNVDFRLHVTSATEKMGRPIIPTETLNRILDYLPQLEIFNEGLLKDLEERIKNWEEKKCISDIFVKKGPFLKLYSSYIRDFETITSTLDEALKKYPQFQATVKEFELSPRCASLALKHYMLKPIQRIPQYRLLLQDYMKHLPSDCPEMKDMQTALAIVSEVAHHANENMRREDYVQKMLEIQRSLIGQFEVIKPGRLFLKEGELKKLSRKEMQPRYFFLFNDVLLYTTPVATGYRLNNVLPLAGMKISVAAQDEYKMEFSIISVQRSFTLHGVTIEERDDWVTALNAAIDENSVKRSTFEAVRAGAQALLDKDFVLGHKAPLWIPDARVTMCMLCTCEFTVTWRRHHCRACGWVVCGNCSEGKAQLRYLKYKLARVCDKCFKTLSEEAEKKAKNNPEQDESVAKDEEDGGNSLSLNGLFERFQKIRRSGRSEKKNTVRPDRLKEVAATDQDASMSGYLQKWHKGKKWKKKQWFLIRDKVLYTFKASQDTAAASSMVLLGYEVNRFNDYFEGVEADLLFQLSHANTEPVVFRTDSATATEKWVTVMRESTVA